MPRKPSKEVIDAAKVKLNPVDVMTAILNDAPECAELRDALVKEGLVQEVSSERGKYA